MQDIGIFTTVYAPACSINDHTFLWSNGRWHLFHIWVEPGGPHDNVIGHAASKNLREWEPQPDILPKDPAPSWEEHPGANAPYVLEWEGMFHLLYSRYQMAPHKKYEMQQIGLATSKDLYSWTKHEKNPVFHPASYWSPWEDSFSDHKGPALTLPVVTRGCKMCESPCVVQHGRRWHLFVNHGPGTHHAAADTPFNFPEPALLCEAHAAEVFTWDGEWYISNCRGGNLGLARLSLAGDRPKLLPLNVGGTDVP